MLALWTQWTACGRPRAGQVEGEAEEAPAGGLGHHLDALHHAGHDLVLDGGVQVLGDLADDEHVHAWKRAGRPGRFFSGRTEANRPSSRRSCTL